MMQYSISKSADQERQQGIKSVPSWRETCGGVLLCYFAPREIKKGKKKGTGEMYSTTIKPNVRVIRNRPRLPAKRYSTKMIPVKNIAGQATGAFNEVQGIKYYGGN